MSTSVVKLYRSGGTYGNWELNPGRLLKLDNIATYLNGKTAVTTTAFQYVKNDLEVKIKVDLSQSVANPKVVDSFKYCSIQNTDGQIHYYFIKKPNWKSLSCVEFELILDVLNTFVEGTDYSFKASTNIIREHKPRFKRGRVTATFTTNGEIEHSGTIANGTEFWWAPNRDELSDDHFHGILESHTENGFTILFEADWDQVEFEKWLEEHDQAVITDGTNYALYDSPKIHDLDYNWYRLIDYVPEGINPQLHAGSGDGEKTEDRLALQQTWHLLYRNVSDPDPDNLVDPVECYLIPDKWVSVKVSSIYFGKMNVNSLEIGKAYIINFTQSSATDIITLDDGTELGSGHLASVGEWGRIIIYRNANNRFAVLLITYYTSGIDAYSRAYAYESQTLTLNHLPLAYRKADLPTMPKTIAEWYGLTPYEDDSWSAGDINLSTDDITDLDRTDPKNIKLIKLPYCPYDFKITGGMIDISNDPNWSYAAIPQSEGDCIALKLNNLDIRLQRNLESQLGGIGYFQLRVRDSAPAIDGAAKSDTRVDGDLESKLFSSEFYQPTYYYDSFTYKFSLEDLDIEAYIEDNNDFQAMPLRFECTSTINSRFMFTFTDMRFRFASSNYANVMPIIRNNEEVLYNVPYVNYIRTGFNYDVKAKNLQFASNMGSLALAGGSLLASLLLPSVPLKVAGIIGSLASFANSAKNAIVSAQSAENSIDAKLKQAENQKASVQGSDDVDLMTSYTENRLKFLEYEPTPIVRKMVDDLFFYAGYRSGRIGLPNHNTRLNFDYLEANVQFENIRSIPNDCLQELANCFKSGVTYLHYNSNITGGYDFDQSHENWETFLFE